MFIPYYQTPNRSPVGDTSACCYAYSITLVSLLGSASRCLWSLNYHVLTAARWACVARCFNRLQKAVSPYQLTEQLTRAVYVAWCPRRDALHVVLVYILEGACLGGVSGVPVALVVTNISKNTLQR